jgi:hypothetical protein
MYGMIIAEQLLGFALLKLSKKSRAGEWNFSSSDGFKNVQEQHASPANYLIHFFRLYISYSLISKGLIW